MRGLVESGQSLFLFLRTERIREVVRGREAAVEQGRRQRDLLSEVVDVAASGKPVALVPIALFWRKGPRSSRRVLNLAYGAPTRPTDLAKVTGFLIAYRELAIKVGEEIDLTAFVGERLAEGSQALARKVRRSILLFLYREERVVEGPLLLPRHRVQEIVLSHPAVAAVVAERAREKRTTPEAARARGRAHLPRDRGEHELDLPRAPEPRGERDLQAHLRRTSRSRASRRWWATRSSTRSCSCRATAPTSTS